MKIFELIAQLQYFQLIRIVWESETGNRLVEFFGKKIELIESMTEELFSTLANGKIAVIEIKNDVVIIVYEG